MIKIEKRNCKVCFQPIFRCSCKKRKHNVKIVRVRFNQVVDVLNVINDQLIGINSSINTNVNNLSTLISNDNTNLNSNMTTSIAALNASLTDMLQTTTNTIISNMNTIQARSCTVRKTSQWSDFSVPCGSQKIFFENFSSPTTEKVIVRAASFQPVESPCRAVLIIVQQDGHVIERLLPPNGSETNLQIDDYSNIAIRCDFGIGDPPPENSDCKGFIQVDEFFCICCPSGVVA
ncbi:hypothetical protein [Cohnella herbarum]|uniref:Uncharacterized protein n=1 Tax=Cohnella herbarum TaxID=2728023 RepID=A0A7Z2ZKI5_9BACL|nr:hypothetical protein [Cohnella herbarum]QJD82880.1 hypothetical protein HH215_06585 [Cohnella herbarum]